MKTDGGNVLVLALVGILVDNFCDAMPRYINERRMAVSIGQLKNSVETMRYELKRLRRSADTPKTLNANYAKNNGIVLGGEKHAFTAVLAEDTTFQQNDVVVFGTEITDEGGAYDNKTGVFTAPVTGTYVFALNIACEYENYIEISIKDKKSGNNLFIAVCKNEPNKEIHQSGGITVAKLDRGNEVYLEMIWPQPGNPSTIKGRGLSSFSGFLLFKS